MVHVENHSWTGNCCSELSVEGQNSALRPVSIEPTRQAHNVQKKQQKHQTLFNTMSSSFIRRISWNQIHRISLQGFIRREQKPQLDARFLSSTASIKEPKAKRRTTLETKDPIILTERAADRIKGILNGDNAVGALGIRLGVKRRGCNGLSYTLNYAFEKPDKDVEMEAHGVKVYIEPMALFNVVGTVMDWEETELSSEFTFNNPNSKGECGCGESFTV